MHGFGSMLHCLLVLIGLLDRLLFLLLPYLSLTAVFDLLCDVKNIHTDEKCVTPVIEVPSSYCLIDRLD